MKTTRLTLAAVLLLAASPVFAQSKTTEALQKKNEGSVKALFFYHNTLSMFNQSDNKEFDELIKDIDKMKFLMIDKAKGKAIDFKKLITDYKGESFEEAMTSRFEGKNFDVYIKGKDKTKGMIVLVNDASMLYVLDIVGSVAFNKIGSLYKTIEGSADFGNLLKDFTEDKKEKKDDDNK